MHAPLPPSPTLKEIWPYYERHEKHRLRSWRDVAFRGGMVIAFFSGRPAYGITPLDVDAYRDHRRATMTRRGKPPTPATINRDVAVLRRLLNFAVDHGLMQFNPIARLSMEPERNIRETILSEEDEERLRAACPPLLRAIVTVLADTGCRRMEALRLRWDQVDDLGAFIDFPAAGPKSSKPRRVPLSDRAWAEISGVKRHPSSPYVFAQPNGRLHNDRHLYRLYQRAVAAAGLQGVNGEPIDLRTIRRTFLALTRRKSIPERTAMAITGHVTRAPFDRVGNLVPEAEIKSAMRKLRRGKKGPR